jgi:hypothetical protein
MLTFKSIQLQAIIIAWCKRIPLRAKINITYENDKFT